MATLLSLVQDVLNEMDGDEVNSISDTAEALQVANYFKVVYENMMANRNWPHTRTAASITGRADSNFPTHMILNEDVKELISVYYDKRGSGETRRKYEKVKYKDPDEFLHILNTRNNDDTNVVVVSDDSGIELLIRNDKHPEYFTSFDETNLIFDSYDSDVDTTLQDSKVQAIGYVIPTFLVQNDYEPNLPQEAIPALREEVIVRAQAKSRQFEDVISAQESRRQSRWLARKSWRAGGGTKYPDFGKK